MKSRADDVVVREIESHEEFHETVNVAKAAWGFSERSLSPAADLIAITHSGGLTAGAFAGKKMLGFVHGIPRTNRGQPCQHSHLLAVRPEFQGRGLSVHLKFFQRSWCLARDIRLVTWTYDPFLIRNARLNLARLRGTVSTFLPNFYGPMGGMYGDLPTDRFEVTWRLDDPLVDLAARGAAQASAHAIEPRPPRAALRMMPAGVRVSLPFPAGAPGIYRSDPAGSRRARLRFGRLAAALFARSFEATGVQIRNGEPYYVLDRR
jgi:chorismate synthase